MPSTLGPKFYLEKHNLHDPLAPNIALEMRVDRQEGKKWICAIDSNNILDEERRKNIVLVNDWKISPAADPEFCFKKMLKEKEKGLTARPLK